jgi:hypothetical protein
MRCFVYDYHPSVAEILGNWMILLVSLSFIFSLNRMRF